MYMISFYRLFLFYIILNLFWKVMIFTKLFLYFRHLLHICSFVSLWFTLKKEIGVQSWELLMGICFGIIKIFGFQSLYFCTVDTLLGKKSLFKSRDSCVYFNLSLIYMLKKLYATYMAIKIDRWLKGGRCDISVEKGSICFSRPKFNVHFKNHG